MKKKYIFVVNIIVSINNLSFNVWWFPMFFPSCLLITCVQTWLYFSFWQNNLLKLDYISLFDKNICSNLIIVGPLSVRPWRGFFILVVVLVMIGPTSRVFKNSRNTIGVVYFRKALGESISKMTIPGVKFEIVKSG